MASSISDFKHRTRKEVTLPTSGLVVEITILDCMAFLGAGELPIPTTDDTSTNGNGASSERLALNVRYIDRAIVMGAINPPFSDRPEQKSSPDVVHVTDLPFKDRMFLGNAIMEWSGLNEEQAEQVNAFRADTISSNGTGISGEIQQIAS